MCWIGNTEDKKYLKKILQDAEEFPTKDNEGTEINLDEIDLNK